MARVGDIEKMVEGLVNRGLVAPKFVGRQVGQATIEELKNLGSNLSESSAIRENSRIQNINQLRSQVINRNTENLGKINQIRQAIRLPGNSPFATGNPYAVGTTGSRGSAGGNQIAVALPGSNGITVSSRPSDDPLAQMAIQNVAGRELPLLNTIYKGSQNQVASIQDLQNFLLKGNQNAEQITGFFNK